MTSAATTRRSLVQGLGTAFALMFGAGVANAQSRVTRFQPARHPQDAWLMRLQESIGRSLTLLP